MALGRIHKNFTKSFHKKTWFTVNKSETILVKANCAEPKKASGGGRGLWVRFTCTPSVSGRVDFLKLLTRVKSDIFGHQVNSDSGIVPFIYWNEKVNLLSKQ